MARIKYGLFRILAILLSVFVLVEVNYPQLTPQAQLSLFAMLGLSLVFLKYPVRAGVHKDSPLHLVDYLLVGCVMLCFGYVAVQTDSLFESFWINGQSLGNRAGLEGPLDHVAGLVGLLLVLEATRRAIGWTLPLLVLAFLGYASFGASMPEWLFPHRGYGWERLVSQVFLHSQGVFGIALKVMFTYVFLFVLFGSMLEQTGATGFILDSARRLFRNSTGGSAKVAVISSGMMGSLSGSAVANTATTGTFTIPMMRSAGFKAEDAGGIEAAASSGGALVPPIMGAGAYMMLEMVEPAVTYLEIVRAAVVPAILYYLSLLLIVHLHSRKIGVADQVADYPSRPSRAKGVVFLVAFVSLICFLVLGFTPFRAVSISLVLVIGVSVFRRDTRIRWSGLLKAIDGAAQGGVSLIAAASCVGVLLGTVTLTGIGTRLPSVLLPLAQDNLVLALLLLMVSTIILGMGLPSAVCYLLMATLVGPVLGDLGIEPLAAHFFIFYFGMMSMVTPPVALAAYTAAAIANSGIMKTALAAFRFALAGFALPYAFVLHPELMLLSSDVIAVVGSVTIVLIGIVPLAAAIVGYGFGPLRHWERWVLLGSALALFLTPSVESRFLIQAAAIGVTMTIGILTRKRGLLVPG